MNHNLFAGSLRKLSAFSLALALVSIPIPARADNKLANFGAGAGTVIYLAAGIGLPLLRDNDPLFPDQNRGRNHALRALDAFLVSGIAAEGLKRVTRVPRPDTGEKDSFPSEHASTTFAVATMESAFHPREAPLWYLGAAAISDSRLAQGRHRIADVLAGAALGFATAKFELSSRRGLLISPFYDSGHSYGVMLSGKF